MILWTAVFGLCLAQPVRAYGSFAQESSLVTHEIRYQMPEAAEVFLVWGVDGWATLPAEMRPAGTVVENAVMVTAMAREGDAFVARVQLPAGTTIDCVFQIKEGRSQTAAGTWDNNDGQDYHIRAVTNGVTTIKAASSPPQQSMPATAAGATMLPLSVGLGLLVGIGAVFALRRHSITAVLDVLEVKRPSYLRDLLRELVVRDMKLRYKRSVLGLAWSLLNPLAQLLVFHFIFGIVFSLNIPNYPSFVFTGLLVWTWFQSALFQATVSIVDNPDLIRRPGFPVSVLPIVTVITHLIHFLLALPVLLPFLLIDGIHFTATWLALPLLMALQFLFTLGLAYIVASIHVIFRDTQHLLGIVLMLVFYLTPIFYDASLIPEAYRPIYNLNPIVHLVEAYRAILMRGQLPPLLPLLFLSVLAGGFLFIGYTIFVRTAYRFVEEL